MARHLLILISTVTILLAITACVTTPPSSLGVDAYQKGDFKTAFSTLRPLAEKGDSVAQYYAARIMLEQTAPLTEAEEGTISRWLFQSAKQGNNKAYASILVFSMTQNEYHIFVRLLIDEDARSTALVLPKGFSRTPIISNTAKRHAETIAGGLFSPGTLLHMAALVTEIEGKKVTKLRTQISNLQLLEIDQKRAESGEKYAQARMGNRYAKGLGVEQDLEAGFAWWLKAATTSAPPRNCVYVAGVDGRAGFVDCYDTGRATPGLPEAIQEVCKAYTEGAGVKQDATKALKWCNRSTRQELESSSFK